MNPFHFPELSFTHDFSTWSLQQHRRMENGVMVIHRLSLLLFSPHSLPLTQHTVLPTGDNPPQTSPWCFEWTTVLQELLHCQPLPWGGIHQEWIAPAWVSHEFLPRNLLQDRFLTPQVHRPCQQLALAWVLLSTASFKHILLFCHGHLPEQLHELQMDLSPLWTSMGAAGAQPPTMGGTTAGQSALQHLEHLLCLLHSPGDLQSGFSHIFSVLSHD